MKKAVFIDRDGAIIQEPPHYTYKLSQLELIDKSSEAIQLLNVNSYLVIVVSNQAGIARGYYKEDDAVIFNNAMKEQFAKAGAYIDAIYFCPHHPEATIEKYRIDCDCRKPKPGMLRRAEHDFSIDLNQSFIIGDKLSDIEAGRDAGCKTIMVRTGHGIEELKRVRVECDHIANDVYDAVIYILSLQI